LEFLFFSQRQINMLRETITLGAGCFWCFEAVLKELKGVISVTSGYMGGRTNNPTYKEVCTGSTGHAEVAQVVFDPAILSLDQLLEVFWGTHDPTTKDRQGADVGSQYQSVIFYHTDEQQRTAMAYMKKLDESGAYAGRMVIEVVPAVEFYAAENYHKDYFALNGEQGYCQMVIRPKLDRFRKVFADRIN